MVFFAFSANAYAFLGLPFFKKEKSDEKIFVKVINEEASQVSIDNAFVVDKGTKAVQIKEIEYSYITEVTNLSDKTVLAVQLVWERDIPFEKYSARKYRVNSTEMIKSGGTKKVHFRLPFDYRDDAYFKVWVKKVLFEDGTVWARFAGSGDSFVDEDLKTPSDDAA
jgi:hypothetical protein